MGLPYGIQCIGQFLLPQLAQLYAGICVPKLRGQLKLLMRLGVGGKLVEFFWRKERGSFRYGMPRSS